MKSFAAIVNNIIKPLTIIAKLSTLDACGVGDHTSVSSSS